MNKKTNVVNKIVTVGVLGVLLGATGGAIVAYNPHSQSELDSAVAEASNQSFQNGFEEGADSVEPVVINDTQVVEKEIEVEKIVEVDNGNLDVVLNELHDNNGRVQYLVEDLEEDEIDQIVDRIFFVSEIKKLAADHVEQEIADLVDKEIVNGNKLDEDDVKYIRVDNDEDEIVVDEIEFEDQDAELLLTGEFEHEDVEYDFEVLVEFKEGKIHNFEIVSLQEQ